MHLIIAAVALGLTLAYPRQAAVLFVGLAAMAGLVVVAFVAWVVFLPGGASPP